jgi:hypothetical protein
LGEDEAEDESGDDDDEETMDEENGAEDNWIENVSVHDKNDSEKFTVVKKGETDTKLEEEEFVVLASSFLLTSEWFAVDFASFPIKISPAQLIKHLLI